AERVSMYFVNFVHSVRPSVKSVVLPVFRVHSYKFVVRDPHGFAKPISMGAPGFWFFTMTALSGRTSTSLYLISSCGFSENSWSLRTSDSRRPPQVYTNVASDC